jgi:flagellar hook-associated protein 3 FlgL
MNIDPMADQFLADLERIQDVAARAQRRISSGKRIETASDAPDDVSAVLALRGVLANNTQVKANLGRVKSEVDTAEATLEQAVKVLEEAVPLAAQAANSTETAQSRATLAIQVRGLHEQLVGLSRATVEGRYIFSGDADQSPSYSLDLTQPGGVQAETGATAAATRRIQDPDGVAFTVARTAQQIFNDPGASAFAALNDLRVALEAGDLPGIQTAIDELHRALEHVNTNLSFYGTAQNRVQSATDRASKLEVQLKSDLSAREDADVTAAILELNQANLHQQAALEARSRTPQRTLFDYLS